MPKSYYNDNNVLNASLRGVPFTPPVASYVALFTSSPTRSGGGTEVSGGGYSRQIVTWTAPVNGQSSNATDITFAVATAVWGTVVTYALMDAPVGGNILYYADMNSPQTVVLNSQVKFTAGQLQAIED